MEGQVLSACWVEAQASVMVAVEGLQELENN